MTSCQTVAPLDNHHQHSGYDDQRSYADQGELSRHAHINELYGGWTWEWMERGREEGRRREAGVDEWMSVWGVHVPEQKRQEAAGYGGSSLSH